MAIKFSETVVGRRKSKTVITIGDGETRRAVEIRLEFNGVTAERFDHIEELEKAGQAVNVTQALQLAYLEVSSPDIVEEDGVTPIPLTAERLLTWENINIQAMKFAVLGESLPKSMSLPTTEDSSSKTASSENDPGTSNTSTSETASA
jgi:hypothetical protein